MSNAQEPKTPRLNRLDPAWAHFAASIAERTWDACTYPHPALNDEHVKAKIIETCADFADAMLRERDRRDREDGE